MVTTTTTAPNETLAKVLKLQKSFPAKLRDKYSDRYSKLLQDMANDAGEFLHNLDADNHTEDEVKTIIKAFPSALSHLDYYDFLPIHSAAHSIESIPFVTLLAEEGVKLEVGGKGKRGGLLVEESITRHVPNVLQLLAKRKSTDDDSIRVLLDAIKKLRESKLLLEPDITQYELLLWSCDPPSKDQFDYFLAWDPEALKNTQYTGNPLLHDVINNWSMKNFAGILKAGMKHYPEHLGFLFEKNNSDGKTACEAAFTKYGKDETFKVIQECIPADANYPVLHHAIKHTPQYMNDFTMRYPSAICLRDDKQRAFHHVALSSGMSFKTDAMFITSRRDEEIEERDPVTELYPFAIAASAAESDLFTIYHLLRRNPSLLERTSACSSKNRKSGKASGKRKRQ